MRIVVINVFKNVDSAILFEVDASKTLIVVSKRSEIQCKKIKKRVSQKKVWRVVFSVLKYLIELFIALLPLFIA